MNDQTFTCVPSGRHHVDSNSLRHQCHKTHSAMAEGLARAKLVSSHSLDKYLQELMNYQRTIEAAAHMGWQSNVGEVRDLANRGPKVKGCGAMRLGMLREDSAYEMHPEYRNAIKGVSQLWHHPPVHICMRFWQLVSV